MHHTSEDSLSIEGYPGLCTVLFDLIESSGSEGISTNEAAAPALALVVIRELGARGGLTGPLGMGGERGW